jgi:hypothetical protein
MDARRYLCSELVILRNSSGECRVNLEEIWRTGAILETEEPLETGTAVEIRCPAAFFAGHVTGVEQHEFGCRVELQFSPMTPWDIEKFRPQHLLDVSSLPGDQP